MTVDAPAPYKLQHADINVSSKSYRGLADDQLLVTKIFFTLQGEGPYAGWPAIFVRLAGCNRGAKLDMGCRFCDTQFQFDAGRPLDFKLIEAEMLTQIRAVMNINPDPLPLVVITGGEPMMQDNLVPFIQFLRLAGWHSIQIESNGDRLAKDFLTNPYCEDVQLVVSPKVVGDRHYRPIKDDVFSRALAFKFVVDHRQDSPYYGLPVYASRKAPDQIFISPLTVYVRTVQPNEVPRAWDPTLIDYDLTQRNYQWAAAMALKHGFRTSMQQHLFFGLE